MTTAPLSIRFRNQTIVQTAQTWPTSNEGWTTRRMFARNDADGLANDVGSAEVFSPGGMVVWPGTTTPANTQPLEIAGHYVRILLESDSGDVFDATSGKFYTPTWHGKIVSRSWKPNQEQTGLDIVYQCAGLLSALNEIQTFHHFEAVDTVSADITLPLTFNAKKKGNRSTDKITVDGPVDVYVFDSTSGIKWTALDVVEYLLALSEYTCPNGPIWTVGGQTSALGFSDDWDVHGMSILEAITRIVNPRQSLGFRCEIVDFQPVVHVISLSKDAIDAGDFTLPASTEQFALDLTDDSEIIDYSIGEDQSATYGKVAIIGGDDLYAMTLVTIGDDAYTIVRDWTDAEATTWATADDDERQTGALAKVYRRFKLNPDWAGGNWDGSYNLLTGKATTSDDLHGTDGFTGELTSGGTALLPGHKFKLTRDIPVPAGYDWDIQDPATADLTKKDMEIQAFVYNPRKTKYQSLADWCERESVQIDIDEDQGAITFGPAGGDPSVAEDIKALFAQGGLLLITIGIKHQMPLMVSWNRPSSEPVAQSRSVVKLRNHMTRRTITAHTAFRVDNGLLKKNAATVELSSDVDDMNSMLALSTPWLRDPEYKISWRQRGLMLLNSGKPGHFYTTAKYRDNVGSDVIVTVNTVVTRRERDYTNGTGVTTVMTKRIAYDISTVF